MEKNNEKISENINEVNEVKKIEVSLEFLKNIRNIIEVSNDRIKWKIEELLPVGIIVKQLDDIIKNN